MRLHVLRPVCNAVPFVSETNGTGPFVFRPPPLRSVSRLFPAISARSSRPVCEWGSLVAFELRLRAVPFVFNRNVYFSLARRLRL